MDEESPEDMMKPRIVRPSVETEVNEEFSFHVDMRVRELVGQRWTEEEARAEAVRRFGHMDRVKRSCRDWGTRRDVHMSRRLGWDELRQDLGYAVRQLRRAPSRRRSVFVLRWEPNAARSRG